MTRIAWPLLATAILFAAVDWLAVAHSNLRLRWVFKPSALLLLIAVALSLHPASAGQRYLFVAALVLSLTGDVLLLLGERAFRAGLATFLAAHLAFSAGFLVAGVNRGLLAYAVLTVAIVSLALGGQVLRSLLRSGNRGMAAPVAAYLLAISATVALAAASGRPTALAGAVLFYASDGMIAWNRFVRPLLWSPLPVMVTYHLAQIGLVLSLAA
jgi:alkenylglycerophosphocholine hydrolase